jgi:hypothetical protein
MAAQTNIQEKRISKGRKRREYKRKPKKNNTFFTFGSEL